mmetsp:Transcript_17152/g.30080  ORF Transcript_17152/g.30080 Transcript_17152/m.30080 type:complete len:456 (+) Transcript_17152:106-1473(+)
MPDTLLEVNPEEVTPGRSHRGAVPIDSPKQAAAKEVAPKQVDVKEVPKEAAETEGLQQELGKVAGQEKTGKEAVPAQAKATERCLSAEAAAAGANTTADEGVPIEETFEERLGGKLQASSPGKPSTKELKATADPTATAAPKEQGEAVSKQLDLIEVVLEGDLEALPSESSKEAQKVSKPLDARASRRSQSRGISRRSVALRPYQGEQVLQRLFRKPPSVRLHIYDVTGNEAVSFLNRVFRVLGTGAFHAGVEIYGTEWSFGCANDGGTGVFSCLPMKCSEHTYREAIDMGDTLLHEQEVMMLMTTLSTEWQGEAYDMLHNNCCHFSDTLCRRLGVGRVPTWVTNLACAGAAVDDGLRAVAAKALEVDEQLAISETVDMGARNLVDSTGQALMEGGSMASDALRRSSSVAIERSCQAVEFTVQAARSSPDSIFSLCAGSRKGRRGSIPLAQPRNE